MQCGVQAKSSIGIGHTKKVQLENFESRLFTDLYEKCLSLMQIDYAWFCVLYCGVPLEKRGRGLARPHSYSHILIISQRQYTRSTISLVVSSCIYVSFTYKYRNRHHIIYKMELKTAWTILCFFIIAVTISETQGNKI